MSALLCDPIRSYRAAFPESGALIAALEGFFDDTNTHGQDGRPAAVAGFLFEPENLERFSVEWAKLSAGLTQPFRAADCYHQNGQFKTWRRDDCRALHLSLARLIGATRGPGFYASVDPVAYRSFLDGQERAEKFLGGKFPLCMLVCANMIGDHLRATQDDRSVNYWFELGSPGEAEAANFIRRSHAIEVLKERYRIEGYWFVKKGTAALVAADFLAWEMQRAYNSGGDTWSDRMMCLHGEGAPPILARQLNATEVGIWAMVNGFYRLDKDHPEPG